MNDTVDQYKKKLTSCDQLCEIIKPGSRVFLSSGPSMPVKTVTEINSAPHVSLQDLEIIQLITLGNYIKLDGSSSAKYRLKTFNTGESISRDIRSGKVDFIPSHLAEIPFIFTSGAIGIDVAIVQTSPPDRRGFMCLGIAIDVATIVIRTASIVVAEVNPNVPVTAGETMIHIDQVDYIIESDFPLLERPTKSSDDIIDKIGWHVTNIIEDGSTVALHAGRVFDAVARHLVTKHDLRIYSHVISDWVIDLIESGAIAVERGMRNLNPVTTSYCYGSRRLYDYVDRNPMFEFLPLLRITYPSSMQRIRRLVSVMYVKKIDLSGESVVFPSGDNLLSGYESKLNFAVGAAFSRGGKAIVALRSMDQDGSSNVVLRHPDTGEQVRSTLGVTRYVVTEFGVANLFGKSIRERTLAMIDIAHPAHRRILLEQAKMAGHLYPDQIYVIENALQYPVSLETVKSLRDGVEVKFRPIKPSDEDMMRRLFYTFSDESKYLRYFAKVRIMPHERMQEYVNIDYENTLSIVGLVQHHGADRIVAEARYSLDERSGMHEMAYLVDEEFQGKGIASFMASYLLQIAADRGIPQVSASVLPQNEKMLRIFAKCGFPLTQKLVDGVMHCVFTLQGE
ncbi:MAG: GNAT family N-acetyltransferase [Spirochaetes bacterium]|nr:GNAT family N-acetyltransferase [Spirochaetota bacterium]